MSEAKNEIESRDEFGLPEMIKFIATITLVAAIIALGFALVTDRPLLIIPALYAALASPFLFGFADIVRNVRVIAGMRK